MSFSSAEKTEINKDQSNQVTPPGEMAIPIPETQAADIKEATFREQSSSHVQLKSHSLNMGRNTANTGCKSGNTAERSTFKKP